MRVVLIGLLISLALLEFASGILNTLFLEMQRSSMLSVVLAVFHSLAGPLVLLVLALLLSRGRFSSHGKKAGDVSRFPVPVLIAVAAVGIVFSIFRSLSAFGHAFVSVEGVMRLADYYATTLFKPLALLSLAVILVDARRSQNMETL